MRNENSEFRIPHSEFAGFRIPHSAFSLVEVVISIAILSVGLVGSMRVFPMGLKASRRAELVSRATLAAERTMASAKLRSWDALSVGTSTTTDEEYTVTVTIDQPDVEELVDPSSLKRVSVSVSWPQEGREPRIDFVTYVRRPPSD